MKKLIPLCLLLSACSTISFPPIPENADFGASPKDYKAMIQGYFTSLAIDPTSVQINYIHHKPQKGWIPQPTNMFSTKKELGYFVCGYFNAKNRYGGYAGRKPFFFGFQEGILVYELISDPADEYPVPEMYVRQLCEQ